MSETTIPTVLLDQIETALFPFAVAQKTTYGAWAIDKLDSAILDARAALEAIKKVRV